MESLYVTMLAFLLLDWNYKSEVGAQETKCGKEEYNPCADVDSVLIDVPGLVSCVRIYQHHKAACINIHTMCSRQNSRPLNTWTPHFANELREITVSLPANVYLIDHKFHLLKRKHRPSKQPKTKTYAGPILEYNENCTVIDDWGDTHTLNSYYFKESFYEENLFPFICQSENFDEDRRGEVEMTINEDTFQGVTQLGGIVRAECSAFVGVTDRVTWLHSNRTGSIIIAADDNRVRETLSWVMKDGRCSKQTSSVLELPATQITGELDAQQTLACIVHDRFNSTHPTCNDTRVACVEKPFVINYMSSEPRLSVQYHGDPPKVFYGALLRLTCRACMETEGNLSWAVEANYSMKQEVILRNDSRLSHGEETRPCGLEVFSTFWFLVTVDIEDQTIVCTSYQINSTGGPYGEQTVRSPPLKLEYGPGTPQLRVHYHMPASRIITGWKLHSTCVACVGNEGNITWRLVDYGDTSLQEELLESLRVMQNSTIEEHIPYCGTNMTSHLALRVNSSLNGSRLACLSSTDFDLTDVDLQDTSLPFVVLGTYPYPPHSYSEEAFPIIVAFLIFLLLMVIARSYLTGRETEEEKSRRRENLKKKKQSERLQPRGKPTRKQKKRQGRIHSTKSKDLKDKGVALDKVKSVSSRTPLRKQKRVEKPGTGRKELAGKTPSKKHVTIMTAKDSKFRAVNAYHHGKEDRIRSRLLRSRERIISRPQRKREGILSNTQQNRDGIQPNREDVQGPNRQTRFSSLGNVEAANLRRSVSVPSLVNAASRKSASLASGHSAKKKTMEQQQ